MNQFFKKIRSDRAQPPLPSVFKRGLLLCVVVGLMLGAGHAGSVGVLGLVRGDVSVKAPSQKQFEPALRYAKIYNGDTIRTGKLGYAEVVLADRSLVRIAPNSSFKVRERGGKKRISLLRGKLWASMGKVFKKRKEVIFESEGIVAAIRGTIIRMERSKEGRVRVASEEGRVEVTRQGSQRRVVLSGSQEVRGTRQQLSEARSFDARAEERWERFADKSYTRELEQAKNALENVSRQIDRFDFSQVKNVERQALDRNASLQEKEGVLGVLGLMLESAETLSVQAREAIWEVKNIYPNRDRDPNKETYDRSYREIQSLAGSKLNGQLEQLNRFKEEVESAIESIEEAKETQRSELLRLQENNAEDAGAGDTNSLFEEKGRALEEQRDSLKTLQKKLEWLKQKADEGKNPKQIEEIMEGIEGAHRTSESTFKDLTTYLQTHREDRSKYKKQYQASKRTYVEVARLKQQLESMSRELLSAAKRQQRREPTSVLVQDPKEDKERVRGLVLRRLQGIDDAIKNLLGSDASTFSRDWVSVKVKLNELLDMARAVKDKELERGIRERLSEYDNVRNFANVNRRTQGLGSSSKGAQGGRRGSAESENQQALTAKEEALLKQLLSVHDKLSEQHRKVEAVQREIRLLAEERIDDPKAMETQERRLERQLAGARQELAKSKSVVERYEALKRQVGSSDNSDLKVLVVQIDKLVLSASIEKERRDLEQQKTNFERRRGQENDATSRRLLQSLTDLRNNFNRHLNEIEIYKRELEIGFSTLERRNRQNVSVVEAKSEEVRFQPNDYRASDVLGAAFGSKSTTLLPVVNDPSSVPRDAEALKDFDEQALGKGVDGLERSIRELESIKKEIESATEAAEVVNYGTDSFGNLEDHFFKRVEGKVDQLERLQKEFSDFREDNQDWVKSQPADLQKIFQEHITTLERQVRRALAIQEPLRRRDLASFSKEAESIKSEAESSSRSSELQTADRTNRQTLVEVERAIDSLQEKKRNLNSVIERVNDAKAEEPDSGSEPEGSSSLQDRDRESTGTSSAAKESSSGSASGASSANKSGDEEQTASRKPAGSAEPAAEEGDRKAPSSRTSSRPK